MATELQASTTTFHDLVITPHPTAPRFEVAECLKCDLHEVFHRTLPDKSFKSKPCIVTKQKEQA